MKIGFFDSGLGGLIMLRAAAKHLPHYDYVYYGDTAHVPYGDRSEEEIYNLTRIGVQHLFEAGCALVIIACNTASAESTRRLQEEFLPYAYPGRKILGVIIPTVEALFYSQNTNALLIGTKRTIDSQKYLHELEKKEIRNVALTTLATPELVPLIEAGRNTDAADRALQYIRSVKMHEVLVLGCTHYAAIKVRLRRSLPGVKVISQDEVLPSKLAQYLERHTEIERTLSREGTRVVHLTKHSSDYDHIMVRLLE